MFVALEVVSVGFAVWFEVAANLYKGVGRKKSPQKGVSAGSSSLMLAPLQGLESMRWRAAATVPLWRGGESL